MIKKYLLAILCVLFATQALAAQNSLNFTRLTSGLHQPQFEKGRTDFALDDINMDGHVDILSIGDHGSPFINSDQHGIMVWFGDGQGNFSLHMEGNFGYGGIAVGDVNNDGFKDVAYGMHHNYSGVPFGDQLIEVALGDGSGMNWTPYDQGLASAGETWGMFGTDLADVNNNGLLDLVSISFGCCNGVRVYLNQGDGSWSYSFGATGDNSNMIVQFADVNNDGYMDIVSSYQHGAVFLGDGTGSFVRSDAGLPLPSGWLLNGISAGDANNNGAAEIAFTNNNGGVQVYRFDTILNMWMNFSGNLPITGNYQFTQLADMNSDGYMDLLAYGNRVLQIWLGDGQGNWTPDFSTTTIGQMGNGRALRTGGDFTNNGYPDIVLVTQEGTWISSKNYLYVYANTTPADSLWIRPLQPKGHERFYPGSVRFIEWASQVPQGQQSTVSLFLSAYGTQGPWDIIAENIPNNGRHQWIVHDKGSDDCYLKMIVYTEADTVVSVTQQPFSILGQPTTIAEHQPQKVAVSPNPGKDQIRIHSHKGITYFKLIDMFGKTLVEVHSPIEHINVSHLPKGVYIYYLGADDQQIFTGKWIKF
jgi:hypothetical protein